MCDTLDIFPGGNDIGEFRCDTTEPDGILVGQRVWYSSDWGLNTMGGICAKLTSPGTTWNIGTSGSGSYLYGENTCPDSTAVWSIDIYSGDWTDRVRLVCGS